MSKFIIQIQRDGTIQIEAEGYSGPQCTSESEELETRIGKVIDREFKPQYYAQETESQAQENQHGF